MKSTTDKGNYYEMRSMKYLKNLGYVCQKANKKIIWIKGRPITLHHDFFGCADIIAIRKDRILFVQVKYQGENTSISMKTISEKFETIPKTDYLHKVIHIWANRKREPKEIFV